MIYYFLAWIWLGALGVVIDLIRHRKDIDAERAAGIRWTLFEIAFLGVAAVLLGPWLLVAPIIHMMRRKCLACAGKNDEITYLRAEVKRLGEIAQAEFGIKQTLMHQVLELESTLRILRGQNG